MKAKDDQPWVITLVAALALLGAVAFAVGYSLYRQGQMGLQ